ncbi:LysR family transcriptional regulator [Vibrio sp. SCSIO 43135]|uniref:LysR family transcriptional regulator n=1 Tax=Vibrio sp. SCSIO 43135 TaxID=2819096 RepID=UPI00207556A7|nr:LysR family transcriptional regulator [Vibrio sp. SCSIO 43135]USD40179.1 LysR family transcriptional regulator [Vibrio sp. SCSIO 43135]
MFSIEQLEAFIATVESGSFSGAARKLGKVQSAVSQHIINLEIDTNVALFDREGRYPKLTSDGHKLLPYARATLLQHQRLKNTAKNLFNEPDNRLVLGIDEGIPLKQISLLIQQLEQDYPNIDLECLSASSTDVIDLVESGRATTGLVFSELSLPSSLDFESIGTVHFDVYASPNHPCTKRTQANIDELRLFRQLIIRSKNQTTSFFHQAFSPDVWYADNYYMLLEFTIRGFGWSLLPSHLAENALHSGELVRVPVDFEQLGWVANVDVIQHQTWSHDPMHKKARQLLRNLLNEI